MRFVHVYLIGYFALIAGAVLSLWRAEVLARMAPAWIAFGLAIAIAPGVALAVLSAKPAVASRNRVNLLRSIWRLRARSWSGPARPRAPQ